jgi:hypothetical protein
MSEVTAAVSTEVEDLKPKKLTNKAQQGMTTFTVCRQSDETGISGEGVVIEGCVFATGHTVIHWLTPALSPMMMGDRLFIQQQAR